jgi:hypothetical protein
LTGSKENERQRERERERGATKLKMGKKKCGEGGGGERRGRDNKTRMRIVRARIGGLVVRDTVRVLMLKSRDDEEKKGCRRSTPSRKKKGF